MLVAERKTLHGKLTIHLYGAIDDRADILQVIGTSVPAEVTFNMRGVNKINSMGTGAWIKFVERLHSAGIKMTYAECSIHFAGALQFVSSARAGGKIESVFAPFRSAKCKIDEQLLLKTPDLPTVTAQISKVVCKACKGPLQFDEIFVEFFSFL